MLLELQTIRTDGETQPRESIDPIVIAEYAEDMQAGATLPPVVVFHDGAAYWLADGFHRYHAALAIGADAIAADVRLGTVEDARWYSYGANKDHGLRRTNEDKRRAVLAALKHPQAALLSDSEIARHCGVHRNTILQYRHLAQTVQDTRTVTRNGVTYEMNIANIGRREDAPTSPAFDDLPFTPTAADYADFYGDANEWTYDPEHAPAYCKYCYETHDNWRKSFDHVPAAWICERCDHATLDQFMQVVDVPAPNLIDTDDGPRIPANFSSASNEWYTPAQYIEAARAVMGGIDLDPASNEYAQLTVKAGDWMGPEHTEYIDGLQFEWNGNVWLNPPYGVIDGESQTGIWARQLISEYDAGRVQQAIFLCNAVTDRQWFQQLWRFPICFTNHRIKFETQDGTPQQPVNGNAFVYLGENAVRFARIFSRFGVVVSRMEVCNEE